MESATGWIGLVVLGLLAIILAARAVRQHRHRTAARVELHRVLEGKGRLEGSPRAEITLWDHDGNRIYWCTARVEDTSALCRRDMPVFSAMTPVQRRAFLSGELGDMPEGYSLRVPQPALAD